LDEETEYSRWGPDETEYVRACEPTDLTITTPLRNPETSKTIAGSFWITPSTLLSHARITDPLRGGGFRVKNIYRPSFPLYRGPRLVFREMVKLRRNSADETIRFDDPVLDFRLNPAKAKGDLSAYLLGHVNDFLMLTSFAARRRSVCVGWGYDDGKSYTEFYRRDISIPRGKPRRTFRDEIVDLADFEEFMKTAYRKFSTIRSKEQVRTAIFFTIPEDGHTMESYFMLLFSALETLVSQVGVDTLLPPKLGKRLRGELNEWLDNQPLREIKPAVRQSRRELLRRNISGIARPPFSVRLDKFLDKYGVDLRDLWPITGNGGGPSLSLLRNRLVHGAHFNYREGGAFYCATENLRWSVERMILALLGWPVSRTRVRADYLSRGATMYVQWREKRASLGKSG
jgi:hypothetical protein